MECAYCKEKIDDDSLFCDQCGNEVLLCPKCKKPGKGKVCTLDGTPLVAAKSLFSQVQIEAGSTQFTPVVGELHLINRNLNLDIKITKDVLIGRLEGDFVDIFGKYDTVSGRHLKISYDPQKGCWVATDLGSTNGSKYNNTPLIPNQPQILADKSLLQIANIEFFVEIRRPVGKTGTVRV